MQAQLKCLRCFIAQTFEALRLCQADDKNSEKTMRMVLRTLAEGDFVKAPPYLSREVYRCIREGTGVADPYLDIKRKYNELALEAYGLMEKLVSDSSDPFATAVKLAVAGNIIDFGVHSTEKELSLEDIIRNALFEEPAINNIEWLRHKVEVAENILYLCDNSGEIVFDKFLVQFMQPKKITCVVRGGCIINDVTMADARFVGLDKIVPVIENGFDAPGTCIDVASDALKEALCNCDLIISKGQGNYETMHDYADCDICFLLKSKCHIISEMIGCQLGDVLIIGREKDR